MSVIRLRKPKDPYASLKSAMAKSKGKPRIGYTQGRANRISAGARKAAIGGNFNAAVPLLNIGEINATEAETPGTENASPRAYRH